VGSSLLLTRQFGFTGSFRRSRAAVKTKEDIVVLVALMVSPLVNLVLNLATLWSPLSPVNVRLLVAKASH